MKNIIIDNISTSYYITQDGKCFNSNTNKYLKGQVNERNGYFSYNLTLPSGKKKRCYAHRLVAEAFIEKTDDKEDQVNHIDGNKLNNCVDNLEWATSEDALENELRKYNHVFCFNKDKQLVAEYLTAADASAATKVNYSIILQELNKDVKALSGNFYWSYSSELGEVKNYKNNGRAKAVNQYDLNGKYITTYPSVGTATRALGLKSHAHIGECCRGKIKTYKGFVWRYVDDMISPSGESQRDISEISQGKMESKWTGTVEDAFFDGEKFDRNRILQKPEYEYSGRSSSQAYYILSVDVGRKGDQTVICALKVTPQPQGSSIKNLVNIFVYEDMHMEDQAITIKKLFYQYKAKRVVIDGNGLGIGLIDYMVKSQDRGGEYYPPFGVYGGTQDDATQEYKRFRTNDTEDEAIYIMKANAPVNTEAFSTIKSQIESGKIKFLREARLAKNSLMGTRLGQNMTPEQRDSYLMPFVLTDILKEELLNLKEEAEGINIILKRSNKRIGKDKFSSLCYGLYYIKQEEDSKKKHKKFNAKEWAFFN